MATTKKLKILFTFDVVLMNWENGIVETMMDSFVPVGGVTGTSPQKSRSRRGMLAVSEAPPVGHSESEEVSRISGAVATQAIHNQGASQR